MKIVKISKGIYLRLKFLTVKPL